MSQETFLKRRTIFHIVVFIITIALAILTYFAKKDPYFGFDLAITRSIQQINWPGFSLLMSSISLIGQPVPGLILAALFFFILLFLKRFVDAFLLIISVGGVEVVGLALKFLVARERPDPRLIHQFGQTFKTDSFPSGHVLYFVTLFGFLLFLTFTFAPKHFVRNLVVFILALLIFLIGPSRIYLGAHWFSDVLAAYLLGFLWLVLIITLHHRFKQSSAI